MTNTHDVIIKLKQVREEKKLSYGDIIEMMEANGDHIAKSTLSNLFKEGSENGSFNYETTIRPVAKAILGIETIEDNDNMDVQAMKSLLKYKIERIEELERLLEREKVKRHEAVEEERRRAEKQEELLREQIAFKDKRMDFFIDAMFKKDEQIKDMMDKILRCQKCEHNV